MIIKNFRVPTKPGKIRAFFSVEWEDKLIIHDMKLIQNFDGRFFVATPSRLQQDGNWTPILDFLDKSLKDKIAQAAKQALSGDKDDKDSTDF